MNGKVNVAMVGLGFGASSFRFISGTEARLPSANGTWRMNTVGDRFKIVRYTVRGRAEDRAWTIAYQLADPNHAWMSMEAPPAST
jgi:hypothetical protein